MIDIGLDTYLTVFLFSLAIVFLRPVIVNLFRAGVNKTGKFKDRWNQVFACIFFICFCGGIYIIAPYQIILVIAFVPIVSILIYHVFIKRFNNANKKKQN